MEFISYFKLFIYNNKIKLVVYIWSNNDDEQTEIYNFF